MGRTRSLIVAVVLALVAGIVGPASSHADPAPTFPVAPHRNPPAITNVGTTSKPLRLVALIPSSYANAASLVSYAKAIPPGAWMDWVQMAYPPPAGSPANKPAITALVTDMPDLLTASHTVTEYQDYLFNKMQAMGVRKARNYQTIYLLFIPCVAPFQMDSFGCVAHHPRLNPARLNQDTLYTSGDSMAVVLGKQTAGLDSNTYTGSHELAEAYTDTLGVGQWRLHSDFPLDPWIDAPPWVRDTGTIELADLAAGTNWYEQDPVSGATFKYQRLYSNYRTTHAFNDVYVPDDPYATYGVSSAAGGAFDWHYYTGPTPTISIPITAWSTAAIGDFTVTASIFTSGGDYTTPCTLPTKTWTVHNASTFNLVVTTPSVTAGTHGWCTIQLKSARPSPPLYDDTSHYWNVGVVVSGPT